MFTFCQRSYHRKCQQRGLGGQKKPKSCQRSLWTPPKREAAKVSVFLPLSTKQTMDNDAMDTNHSSLLAWISSIYFVFCLENYFHIFLYFLFLYLCNYGLLHVYFLAKVTIAKVLEFIFQFIVRTWFNQVAIVVILFMLTQS